MIVRAIHDTHYTTINNSAANDSRLSLKAKGMWLYLMTKPNDWDISTRGAMTQLKEGRDGIRAALAELERCGYLIRDNRSRGERGRFKPTAQLLETPWSEKPSSVNPTSDNPTQVINNRVSNNTSLREGASTSDEIAVKAKAKIYGKPDINQVIEKFQTSVGKLTSMKKQRIAAENLIKTHGLERVLTAIDTVVALRGENYTPVISDLQDLSSKKWAALETALMRRNNAPNSSPKHEVGRVLHKRRLVKQPELSPEEREREAKAIAARRAENRVKYAPKRTVLV